MHRKLDFGEFAAGGADFVSLGDRESDTRQTADSSMNNYIEDFVTPHSVFTDVFLQYFFRQSDISRAEYEQLLADARQFIVLAIHQSRIRLLSPFVRASGISRSQLFAHYPVAVAHVSVGRVITRTGAIPCLRASTQVIRPFPLSSHGESVSVSNVSRILPFFASASPPRGWTPQPPTVRLRPLSHSVYLIPTATHQERARAAKNSPSAYSRAGYNHRQPPSKGEPAMATESFTFTVNDLEISTNHEKSSLRTFFS